MLLSRFQKTMSNKGLFLEIVKQNWKLIVSWYLGYNYEHPRHLNNNSMKSYNLTTTYLENLHNGNHPTRPEIIYQTSKKDE